MCYSEQNAAELALAQAAQRSPKADQAAPPIPTQPRPERAATPLALGEIIKVVNLANAIREYGHLAAQLDPLGAQPPGDPALHLDYFGLSEETLRQLPADPVGGPVAETAASAWEAIEKLREVYSATTGHDYDHLRNPDERSWLREVVAESQQFRPPNDPINPTALLERLTQVEGFEK